MVDEVSRNMFDLGNVYYLMKVNWGCSVEISSIVIVKERIESANLCQEYKDDLRRNGAWFLELFVLSLSNNYKRVGHCMETAMFNLKQFNSFKFAPRSNGRTFSESSNHFS